MHRNCGFWHARKVVAFPRNFFIIFIYSFSTHAAMEINLIVLRLLPVLIGSLFFGLIRQKLHKPISFGTFTFVSFGSCALALLSLVIPGGSPLLLVGSIVTGIGFLGAGALMRTPDKTLGFTS